MSLAARVRGKAKVWFIGRDEEIGAQGNQVVVRSMDDDAKEKEKDSFWLELKEFSRAHILECSTFVIFLLFSIYCIFNAFGFIGTNELTLRASFYEHKVIHHCQFLENQDLHGTEGITDHPNVTLVSLLTVVRHGDRYGIRKGASRECQVLNEQENERFEQYVAVAKKLDLPKLLKLSPEVEQLRKVPDIKVCEPRTLTPRGAIQEFSIGRYLAEKYKDTQLFNSSENPISLTVTTSQKQRTVASGIALVSGILDQNHTKFMTPVEFKSGKFYYGCTDPECSCDTNFGKIDNLERKEREGMFRMDATERMKTLTGYITANKTEDTPTNDPNQILDYLVAEHICQRRPLPCEQNYCTSWSYVGDLVEFSISQSVKRYELDMGVERQYRVISAYPILRSLALLMGREEKEMQVFSSHDTVVASILRVLTGSGSYTDLQVYAARIVFEIYETPSKQRLFRVVYNGDDITSLLTFCKDLEFGLCPAAELQQFVAKGIFQVAGYQTFNETCNANFLSVL